MLWKRKGGHTVDAGLEGLAARFAGQIAYAGLLVDLHRHGGLVVAEDAAERGREWFALLRGVRL